SFGVVLSEIDVHTLPYSKRKNRDSNGKLLPDALILQQVAMGKLQVDFSETTPESLVELGKLCVSVDPNLRPTAAEAMYRLQIALTHEID
ncbi:TKL protein kinase, partial [Phytophthora megakarya]